MTREDMNKGFRLRLNRSRRKQPFFLPKAGSSPLSKKRKTKSEITKKATSGAYGKKCETRRGGKM
jgi:hypothetical protein